MAYGHAERTLAAIRLLEAETRELLNGLEPLDPDHVQWLQDAARSAALRLRLAAKDDATAGTWQAAEPADPPGDGLRLAITPRQVPMVPAGSGRTSRSRWSLDSGARPLDALEWVVGK